MRILLAERDPALRARLAKELRNAGYAVQLVETGEAVRVALRGRQHFGLVVAGPCPRTGDAMRVLEHVRRRGCVTPFLVLPPYPDDVLRDAAFRLGAMTFERPFRPIEFCSYVRCVVPSGKPVRSWRSPAKVEQRPRTLVVLEEPVNG